MLELVGDETARIDSRFLEPACGSGNFLAAVLTRKFAAVDAIYGKSEFERKHHALLAVMCTYGIELLEDNVSECRARLAGLFAVFLKLPANDEFCQAARHVLEANIVHGDALSMTTRADEVGPIVFAEWAYLGKGRFQRRDFRFDALAQVSSFGEDTLFGSVPKNEIFAPVREYPPLTARDLTND